ncbi:sensor histidine kinase [Tessaracoccus coleopterorum]|uniref:sensor histidine kinase n=1 Tax=Tessaracoccus coleopterorum TaxID=2714950 RepID=UPI0038CD2AC4
MAAHRRGHQPPAERHQLLGERARVTVSVAATEKDGDQQVEIKVSDNGIGIKLEDQERIFERFYRVDYGRSRASGGTGLGLSIVRHIAAAHGGTVRVWSRPGQGSTFTLCIPCTWAPRPKRNPKERPNDPDPDHRGRGVVPRRHELHARQGGFRGAHRRRRTGGPLAL